MSVTLRINESTPATRPTIETGITDVTSNFLTMVWERMDVYLAYRWGERACTFTVEGNGHWESPLKPFTISTTKIWLNNNSFQDVTLDATPLGGIYLQCGQMYEITGTLGSSEAPPAVVSEAYCRLANYLHENTGEGAGELETSLDGVFSTKFSGSPMAARAFAYSGAGDLLRAYRNKGAQ